jgi:hypothetical protein
MLQLRQWRDRLLLQEDLNFLLTNRVPRQALTRFMGRFSKIRNPWVCQLSIALWRMFTELDLSEARKQNFESLHDCFTRELRSGARTIDRDPKVLSLTREFFEQGKLVAFICHGGWIPISAKILPGRRVTGSLGIKDDLENAGGLWVDAPVVVDGNLISSRTPRDLAPFARAMVDFLTRTT